jgi:uncharacterized repeat protein (TIGR01451 family)
MSIRLTFLALVLLGAAGSAARAQWPPPLPCRGPAPLLFVRFTGPAGMRATFYQGRAPARTHAAPVVMGLRPGYCYRVQLSGLAGRPGVALFPTLEVRGSLTLPPHVQAANYPLTLNLSESDISAALSGSLVTKVYYLEHPDRAEPEATQRGEVLETEAPPTRDLCEEAGQRGRVVLILRLGDSMPTAEDLAEHAVSGTLLHPGEKYLPPPARPPCVPWSAWPFHDPYLGPRLPEEECLHDGGDRGERAALGPDGKLYGLDPEDTVAEFTDSKGRRGVTCSNRVCLCVPRFAALRSELPLAGLDTIVGLDRRQAILGYDQLKQRRPSEQARAVLGPDAFKGRLRPSVNVNTRGPGVLTSLQVLQAHHVYLGLAELLGTQEVKRLTQVQRVELVRQVQVAREFSVAARVAGTEQVVGTAVLGRVEGGPQVVSGTLLTRDLTVCCNEAPAPPDKPLLLVKCADRTAAHPGDVITFSLRYSNHGGRVITDVAVTDSLSGRLEYIPGSAESDREAVFTTQPNEAGSLILRWEISGRLQPGETGRLRFKARVR